METGADVADMSTTPLITHTPAVSPLVVPPDVEVVQKVIRVLREPGVALGMSVAGGIGALPSDSHDEVGQLYVYLRASYAGGR